MMAVNYLTHDFTTNALYFVLFVLLWLHRVQIIMGCPFLIGPSVLSNVYIQKAHVRPTFGTL
jgi:hypothetical protein